MLLPTLVGTLCTLSVCMCQRRILMGEEVSPQTTNKPSYVVYIVESSEKPRKYYDGVWMCVGSIISEKFVLTSGACLTDIMTKDNGKDDRELWVISGTLSYVYGSPDAARQAAEAKATACVDATKKVITKSYVPQSANFGYSPSHKWMTLDIGIAEVAPLFDFGTNNANCDYDLTAAVLSFDKVATREGQDAIVYGWGSSSRYRQTNDTSNINNPKLRYAQVKLINKVDCIKAWPRPLSDVIRKYMICSLGRGLLKDDGNLEMSDAVGEGEETVAGAPNTILIDNVAYVKECVTRRQIGAAVPVPCVSDGTCACPVLDGDHTRRHGDVAANSNATGKFIVRDGTTFWRRQSQTTKREGFCQNDHGAPIMTWVGPKFVQIGVASAFLAHTRDEGEVKKGDCKGPFTYMGIHCNGAFIKCILSNQQETNAECRELTKNNLRIMTMSKRRRK